MLLQINHARVHKDYATNARMHIYKKPNFYFEKGPVERGPGKMPPQKQRPQQMCPRFFYFHSMRRSFQESIAAVLFARRIGTLPSSTTLPPAPYLPHGAICRRNMESLIRMASQLDADTPPLPHV